MAGADVVELVRRYALVGLGEWRQSHTVGARSAVAQLLGARVAESEYDAMQAVYTRETGQNAYLLPAMKLTASDVEWAFFKPRQDRPEAQWMFDVVFWLKDNRHICFRLEPADGSEDARHGYSHMQLSWRFNGKQSVPQTPLRWLPVSYPAFPLPGRCSLDRFLMLVAALHGFPACTRSVLEEIWPGLPGRGKKYVDRVHSLLSPA